MALADLSLKVVADMQLNPVVTACQAAHAHFVQEALEIIIQIFRYRRDSSPACGVYLHACAPYCGGRRSIKRLVGVWWLMV